MKEMQQFGCETVIAFEIVAVARFGDDRPDQSSATQLPQKIGLNRPQPPYQSGAGLGFDGLHTVWTLGVVTHELGQVVLFVQPVSPDSNPPLLKQFGVPTHGTVGQGVNVSVWVLVGLRVYVWLIVQVRLIVFVFHGVQVRDSVGGHVTDGVGDSGGAQQSITSA